MRRANLFQSVLVAVMVVSWSIGSSQLLVAGDAYDEAVARALRLLPRPPERVQVVETGRPHVDAFVNEGERVVYVRKSGETLQHASRGPGIFDYVLAITIWHEMAHLDGADEPEAQRREEQLWINYIITRRVDSTRGLNYLRLLVGRRQ